ncbi:MAG: tetratricopeptide repeat protein [Planctomycetota bacterium]
MAIEKALRAEPNAPAAAIRAAGLYSMSADADVRRKAPEVIEAALRAHPEDAELALVKARNLLGQRTAAGRAEARRVLERVTQAHPGRVDAWMMLAQTSLLEGLPDAALDAVSKGLAAGPSEGQRRGLMFLKADAEKVRWPAIAATTLRELWEGNRKDLAAGLALASAYRSSGDARKAIGQLEEMQGVFEGAERLAVDLALADAYEGAGQGEKALAITRGAAASSPDDARPVLAVMRMLLKDGRVEEARGEIEAWRKAHPEDAMTMMLSSQVAVRAGEALKASAEAVERDKGRAATELAYELAKATALARPEDAGAKLALATVAQIVGRTDEAEGLYREVLTKAAANPIALNNLAWLLCEEKKEYDEALALADRGRESAQGFPDLVDTRGVIYYRMGRLPEAKKELETAVQMSLAAGGSAASAKFHLARVLAGLREQDEAVSLLEESLARPPVAGGIVGAEREEAEALLKGLKGG